jgi:hypothetical protein
MTIWTKGEVSEKIEMSRAELVGKAYQEAGIVDDVEEFVAEYGPRLEAFEKKAEEAGASLSDIIVIPPMAHWNLGRLLAAYYAVETDFSDDFYRRLWDQYGVLEYGLNGSHTGHLTGMLVGGENNGYSEPGLYGTDMKIGNYEKPEAGTQRGLLPEKQSKLPDFSVIFNSPVTRILMHIVREYEGKLPMDKDTFERFAGMVNKDVGSDSFVPNGNWKARNQRLKFRNSNGKAYDNEGVRFLMM